MGIQENKSVVLSVIDALQAGDIPRFEALTTDDLIWWIAPTSVFSGTYSKAEWTGLMKTFFEDTTSGFKLNLAEITAEEDRVSVIAKGHFVRLNGAVYQSDYHFLFFVRDGKVSKVKDYPDSYHTALIFGFPETAGQAAEPVAAQ